MNSKSSFTPDFLNNYQELGHQGNLQALAELKFALIS